MRVYRWIGTVLLPATLLSCGGSRINLKPLLQQFDRYEEDLADLNPGSQAADALQAGRSKRAEAVPMLEKGREKEALPILQRAIADARFAWTLAAMYEADRQADHCRRLAERGRQQWENAMITLEQTERSSNRTVAGVTREPPGGDERPPQPLPRTVLSGPEPPRGDWKSLSDTWNIWWEAARDRGVNVADLSSRFNDLITSATDKETKEEERPLHLYLAGRTIQELEARVRTSVSEAICTESILLAEQSRESSEAALLATLDLQRTLTEELQSEATSRQDELYAALHQIEGKYARITREARGTIVSLADILFDFDKATLKRDMEFNLVKIATILNQFPEMNIRVEGHTDNIGTEAYNLDLSKRRGKAVFDFLASQGVEAARMTAEGYGMSRPVADNATDEGRQRNRRVDLVIQDQP